MRLTYNTKDILDDDSRTRMFREEHNIWESNNIIYYIKGIWVNGEVNSNFLIRNIHNEINRQ